MTRLDPKLEVQLVGDEIIVTLPGTDYSVTYYRLEGVRGLMVKRIANKDDPRIPRMRAMKSGELSGDREAYAGVYRSKSSRHQQ